ncbi:MAG TPA: DUF5134 domain-containing protein [Micromonosporaceae bacterium]|jgi:hypothetical protein|nr:DUF5134 domain-containing protein [Micromonosporaceae bacterium]
MGGTIALRWLLTAAFALAGSYCTAQCLAMLRTRTEGRAATVLANVAHVAMSLAMIGAVWWAPSWRVVTWEMAIFAVAGGWFAVRVIALRQRATGCVRHTPTSRGGVYSKLACAHHAAAMAAMVWMLTAMVARPGMAGMPTHASATPTSRALTAAVLGGYFAVAAACWLVGGTRRRGVPGATAHGLMSAAMGTAFLTLA